jgi:Domain of unknown function (DUF5615)
MKILIDECLPDELKESVAAMGHECQTVRRAGYGSKRNGELLALAEGLWDVLLTSDRNIKYQQSAGKIRLHPDCRQSIQNVFAPQRRQRRNDAGIARSERQWNCQAAIEPLKRRYARYG